MPLPPENINANITPREFELLVKAYLQEIGSSINTFNVKHDVQLQREDGRYQIDVFVEFELLGSDFKVLIECKKHKDKVKRDVVQLLFDKIRATGAHKGMIFSTSGFQKGALLYARKHGIALIRIIEGKYTYFTKSRESRNFDPPTWVDLPKFVGEFITDEAICYLQNGHLEPLREFIMVNKE